MSVSIATPDATLANTGAVTGAASAHAALADVSDASYVEFDGGESGTFSFGAPSPSFPAGSEIKSLALLTRSAANGVLPTAQDTKLFGVGGTPPWSPLDYISQRLQINGTLFTQLAVSTLNRERDPDDASAQIGAPSGYSFLAPLRVSTLQLWVEYVAKPTLTVDAPSGTLTEDNLPLISWTPTLDASGGGQALASIKIFDTATYSAGGFDPATSTPVDSGVLANWDPATSWRGNVALADDDYRAYVQVVQVWTDGDGARVIASDWESSDFTVDVDKPAAPTISVIAIGDGAPAPLVAVSMNGGGGGAATTSCFQAQFSDDEGETWENLRTMVGDGLTVDTTRAAVYDFEAPPGQLRRYRVRGVHHYSLSDAYSETWTEGEATLNPARWGIVQPLTPLHSWDGDLRSFPSQERAARQSVKQPVGRSDAVPVSDTRAAETGTLVARLSSDYERDRIQATATDHVPVLLNPPSDHHEPQRWVALGDEIVERLVDKSWIDERDASYGWTKVGRPSGNVTAWPTYYRALLASNPALIWRMNEASGTVVTDASGNGNHGKIYDAQAVASTGVLRGFWAPITRDFDSQFSAQISGDWTATPTQTHPGAGMRADAYKPFVPGSARSFSAWLFTFAFESFQTIFSSSLGNAVGHTTLNGSIDLADLDGTGSIPLISGIGYPLSGGNLVMISGVTGWISYESRTGNTLNNCTYHGTMTGTKASGTAVQWGRDAGHPTWEMGAPSAPGMMRYYANVNRAFLSFLDWGTANTDHPATDFTALAPMHIVCTYDDATGIADWFVNGRSQGQQGPYGYLSEAEDIGPIAYDPNAGDGLFQVGWRGGAPLYAAPGNTEVYYGRISDIAVHERILDPDEVDFLYRCGKPS